jgi:DNA excision repair protein ERCC-5
LRRQETKEVIDLDAPASQTMDQDVIGLDSDAEDVPMEDTPVADTELRMGDLADKVRAEPPKPLSPQQRSPPRQDPTLTKKTPFADESDDEPVDWSESEPEDEKRTQAMERPAQAAGEPVREPSRSPSEEFEDVPMTEPAPTRENPGVPLPQTDDMAPTEAVQAPEPKSPSPDFEDIPIRTDPPPRPKRRHRSPSPAELQGPDDLEIPIVPQSGVADDTAHLDLPGNDSDQYSENTSASPRKSRITLPHASTSTRN